MTTAASLAHASPVNAAVGEASPHQMVCMLLDGASSRLSRAEAELPAGGCESLDGAVRILRALQSSLDMPLGGELAANLYDLYRYMLRRLEESRAALDPAGAAEVRGLLATIQDAWEAIAPEVAATPD